MSNRSRVSHSLPTLGDTLALSTGRSVRLTSKPRPWRSADRPALLLTETPRGVVGMTARPLGTRPLVGFSRADGVRVVYRGRVA